MQDKSMNMKNSLINPGASAKLSSDSVNFVALFIIDSVYDYDKRC